MTTAVVGVGNEFRGDDAIGLEVVRMLAGTVADDVRILECEGEPVSLIEAWAGCDRVVVVDAMQSGATPGSVRRIVADEEALPPELHRPSTHLLGVAEAIELARALGRLPASLVVYAVEGGQFDAGSGLSPAVAAAASAVCTSIRNELRET